MQDGLTHQANLHNIPCETGDSINPFFAKHPSKNLHIGETSKMFPFIYTDSFTFLILQQYALFIIYLLIEPYPRIGSVIHFLPRYLLPNFLFYFWMIMTYSKIIASVLVSSNSFFIILIFLFIISIDNHICGQDQESFFGIFCHMGHNEWNHPFM